MVKYWGQGFEDAANGIPSKHKNLKGDAKACYINGYREGAEYRALMKQRG